jgi:ketosteroid isomerase-like protein
MKQVLLLMLLVWSSYGIAQKSDSLAILKMLEQQTTDWNKGDLESFMRSYWKHDSLMFISRNGVTYGWENAFNNYQRSFPDTAAMGKLSFDILQVKQLSSEYFFVTGKWMLRRTAGDLNGLYTLVIRKINGSWKIIADHSP